MYFEYSHILSSHKFRETVLEKIRGERYWRQNDKRRQCPIMSDLYRSTNEDGVGAMHVDFNGRFVGDGQVAIHLRMCRHEYVVSGDVEHHYTT